MLSRLSNPLIAAMEQIQEDLPRFCGFSKDSRFLRLMLAAPALAQDVAGGPVSPRTTHEEQPPLPVLRVQGLCTGTDLRVFDIR